MMEIITKQNSNKTQPTTKFSFKKQKCLSFFPTAVLLLLLPAILFQGCGNDSNSKGQNSQKEDEVENSKVGANSNFNSKSGSKTRHNLSPDSPDNSYKIVTKESLLSNSKEDSNNYNFWYETRKLNSRTTQDVVGKKEDSKSKSKTIPFDQELLSFIDAVNNCLGVKKFETTDIPKSLISELVQMKEKQNKEEIPWRKDENTFGLVDEVEFTFSGDDHGFFNEKYGRNRGESNGNSNQEIIDDKITFDLFEAIFYLLSIDSVDQEPSTRLWENFQLNYMNLKLLEGGTRRASKNDENNQEKGGKNTNFNYDDRTLEMIDYIISKSNDNHVCSVVPGDAFGTNHNSKNTNTFWKVLKVSNNEFYEVFDGEVHLLSDQNVRKLLNTYNAVNVFYVGHEEWHRESDRLEEDDVDEKEDFSQTIQNNGINPKPPKKLLPPPPLPIVTESKWMELQQRGSYGGNTMMDFLVYGLYSSRKRNGYRAGPVRSGFDEGKN